LLPSPNTRILAITGGIGSGKSEVGRYLTSVGGTVIDADVLVHNLLADPAGEVCRQIATEFGDQLLGIQGIDRKQLGAIVFADEARRQRLETILHPAVRVAMALRIQALQGTVPLLAVEVPLLFESGMNHWFTEIWLVIAPVAVRQQRLQRREPLSASELHQRMAAQWPDSQKIRLATHIIDNHGEIADLHRQIDRLLVPI